MGGSGGSVAQLQALMNGSKTMEKYSGLLGNLTSCVLIDRIRFYPSEEDKTYVEDLQKEFRAHALAGGSLFLFSLLHGTAHDFWVGHFSFFLSLMELHTISVFLIDVCPGSTYNNCESHMNTVHEKRVQNVHCACFDNP